jgi:hypothetical protein
MSERGIAMLYISMDVMTNKPVCNEADCAKTDARLYTRGGDTRSLCVNCADRFCEECGVRYGNDVESVGMFHSNGDLARIICEDCVRD